MLLQLQKSGLPLLFENVQPKARSSKHTVDHYQLFIKFIMPREMWAFMQNIMFQPKSHLLMQKTLHVNFNPGIQVCKLAFSPQATFMVWTLTGLCSIHLLYDIHGVKGLCCALPYQCYAHIYSPHVYLYLMRPFCKWVIPSCVTQCTEMDLSRILTMAGALGNESKHMKPRSCLVLNKGLKQARWPCKMLTTEHFIVDQILMCCVTLSLGFI